MLNLNFNTMKKFTLLMSLVVMASIAFAQVVGVHAPVASKDKVQTMKKSQLKNGNESYDGFTVIKATQSSEADIVDFMLAEQTAPATIDAGDQTVAIEVGFSVDLTDLTPTITVSDGASIDPESGVAQDFTNPVTYTVTAEDNTEKTWTVTVTNAATQNSEANILTFELAEQTAPATIDAGDQTVAIEVEYATDVTELTPTITVSYGASINPESGVAQDFTNPVTYSVTAEDGTTTEEWVVTVTEAAQSSEADILTFEIAEQTGPALINTEEQTVSIEVVNSTDLTSLTPTITVSEGASINPESGVAQDFTNPVTYSVTAEDGITALEWVVTVTEASPLPEGVYWQVTFEEEIPVWSFGYDLGDKSWNVTDQAGAPSTWEPQPDSYYIEYLGAYSETGNEVDGHWAWVDIISDYPALGGSGQEVCNTWIQFDNIDLTDADNPKIEFYQMYRPLNDVGTFIELSTDDGATWTTVEVNGEVFGNEYAPVQKDLYIGNYVANEPNVSIRFRWETFDPNPVVGYAWQIDDLKIVDNAQVDMVLKKGVMNFFEYVDYTDPANSGYFHISSHYGMIPEEQFEAQGSAMVFNAIVENKGNLDKSIELNVQVFDPEMTEIYNETANGSSLSTAQVDTVDLLMELIIDAPAMRGEYTVVYNVVADDDANADDNTDTTYFNITDEIYARDLGNPVSAVGPGQWLDGGNDGDMVGTNYFFLYETSIESLDVFVTNDSDAGTSMVAHVMGFDEASREWVDIATSALVTVDEAMLGDWYSFEFPDAIEIIPEPDAGFSVKAAIEFFYNNSGTEEKDLFIGYEYGIPVSAYGTSWFFTAGSNPNTWYSITNWSRGGISIRLNTPKTDAVADFNIDEVNVYPNPTTGLFNIQNVRGADVEIFNMVGQRVYSATEVEENITVDLSNLSEGSYIVRISGLNTVKTQKINLIK
jgi:hypothetical protein